MKVLVDVDKMFLRFLRQKVDINVKNFTQNVRKSPVFTQISPS